MRARRRRGSLSDVCRSWCATRGRSCESADTVVGSGVAELVGLVPIAMRVSAVGFTGRLSRGAAREWERSWRREWDSNFPTSFRFCNLQIRQCHGCHECQRCRRALPAIARSRSGPAVRAGRRRGSPQNVSGNRSSRPRTPSRIRPDLPFRIQSKCFHVDAGRSVRASPRLAGSGVFAPPRRSPSSRACRLA